MSALPKGVEKLLSGEVVDVVRWPNRSEIWQQMTRDVRCALGLEEGVWALPDAHQVKERWSAHPEDTDPAQCWSEEFFSLLAEEFSS